MENFRASLKDHHLLLYRIIFLVQYNSCWPFAVFLHFSYGWVKSMWRRNRFHCQENVESEFAWTILLSHNRSGYSHCIAIWLVLCLWLGFLQECWEEVGFRRGSQRKVETERVRSGGFQLYDSCWRFMKGENITSLRLLLDHSAIGEKKVMEFLF